MEFDQKSTIRVVCAPAVAGCLEREMACLGYELDTVDETGVETVGTLHDAMRLNLCLRTAMYVLYLLDEFDCPDPQVLYDRASEIAWEEIIPADSYVTVTARVDTATIDNSTYVSLKVKDAIVDRIGARKGRRPDSGPDRHRCVVNVYWRQDRCWIHLNTSGRKLSDRGYRKIPLSAPMQETLSAAALLAGGYDGSATLVNPMCGSGTLAIEAALVAAERAPGLLRSSFAFQYLDGFDVEGFNRLRKQIRTARPARTPPPIIASDVDPRAVEAARKNAETAGVQHLIEFHTCDFAETPLPNPPGLIIMNPEYGERLGRIAALEPLYKRIGDFFKQRCAGWTGLVFTGNLDLAKKIGLRTSRRIPFFNGTIECRLLQYELYEGSRRKRDNE